MQVATRGMDGSERRPRLRVRVRTSTRPDCDRQEQQEEIENVTNTSGCRCLQTVEEMAS